ncbi:MAG: SAM-dependent methyltransferase [Bacilli bacterium]|nr:SAM-dependent methyltransferase [Bacilli bacterium]
MNENEIILEILKDSFIEAIISQKEKNNKTNFNKVVINRKEIKGSICYQFSFYDQKQVHHKNIDMDNFANEMNDLFINYRQFLIRQQEKEIHVIKNGAKFKSSILENCRHCSTNLDNNRKKNYILNEGDKLDFLVEQGVMSTNYLVKNNMQHKFRQINRFLEFIQDIVDYLPKDRQINIIDFGCGKSYLTFAVYHYLVNILGLDVHIHGLDLKQDVINDCNKLSMKLGFTNLSFEIGDIATYKDDKPIDLVVTLHACDTATDYALYNAIKWNTKIILSVPCCQHEINNQIKNDEFNDIFKYGIIKERTSSLLTDALRANLLEISGYKTQLLEFIDMEHTPKNILIRAVKTGNTFKNWDNVDKIVRDFNLNPTLYRLLKNEQRK